jgi:hypothetical protein
VGDKRRRPRSTRSGVGISGWYYMAPKPFPPQAHMHSSTDKRMLLLGPIPLSPEHHPCIGLYALALSSLQQILHMNASPAPAHHEHEANYRGNEETAPMIRGVNIVVGCHQESIRTWRFASSISVIRIELRVPVLNMSLPSPSCFDFFSSVAAIHLGYSRLP